VTIYERRIPLKVIRERRVVARHRSPHGFQAGDGRIENLAKTQGQNQLPNKSHPGCQIPRRNRSRARSQIRRLIHAATLFEEHLPIAQKTLEISCDPLLVQSERASWYFAGMPREDSLRRIQSCVRRGFHFFGNQSPALGFPAPPPAAIFTMRKAITMGVNARNLIALRAVVGKPPFRFAMSSTSKIVHFDACRAPRRHKK
jgi:hypothetical protein